MSTNINTFQIPTELSKSAIHKNVELVLREIEDGQISALELSLKLKWIIENAQTIFDVIKPNAVIEIERYNKFERKMMGAKFDVVQGRRMPQFKQDSHWHGLNEALKEREKTLNAALISKDEYTDPNTGEVVPKVEINYGSSYIKIEF